MPLKYQVPDDKKVRVIVDSDAMIRLRSHMRYCAISLL